MKKYLLLLTLAAMMPLQAQPAPQNPPGPPGAQGDAAIPVAGFTAPRYEALWTKSPFAVASSEEETVASPDYMLFGIATIDGVSYASLLDRQSSQHFLISSDAPNRGMTLTSIKRGENGGDTTINVLKDGQTLTLKLEQPAAGAPAEPQAAVTSPQIPMPGGGATGVPSMRPFARIHRPLIHLPPQQQQQQPPPAPNAPPPSPP